MLEALCWLLCIHMLASVRGVRLYDNMQVCECACRKCRGCILDGQLSQFGEKDGVAGSTYVGLVCCRLLTLMCTNQLLILLQLASHTEAIYSVVAGMWMEGLRAIWRVFSNFLYKYLLSWGAG